LTSAGFARRGGEHWQLLPQKFQQKARAPISRPGLITIRLMDCF
jgi:hypothetical protein